MLVLNTIFANNSENFLFGDSSADSGTNASEESNFQNDAFNSVPSDVRMARGSFCHRLGGSNLTGINPNSTFVNSAGNNFHEIAGAPTIDTGKTIAFYPQRPRWSNSSQGAAYDIGA